MPEIATDIFSKMIVAISISLVRQRWKSRLAVASVGSSVLTIAKSE